jgi:hypothetical protein
MHFVRGCIQKFLDWVNNDINYNNNKHSLRSNTKGYGGKTHYTDSQNSDTTAPSGIELYHLHFSLQAASLETFEYTLIYGVGFFGFWSITPYKIKTYNFSVVYPLQLTFLLWYLSPEIAHHNFQAGSGSHPTSYPIIFNVSTNDLVFLRRTVTCMHHHVQCPYPDEVALLQHNEGCSPASFQSLLHVKWVLEEVNVILCSLELLTQPNHSV